MAIDFGSFGGSPVTPTPVAPGAVVDAPVTGSGITLDLSKGSSLNLTKNNPSLSRVRLGAGWDIAIAGDSYDLDIAAFLLHANGKIQSNNDVIFFNNKTAPGIVLGADNRTGAGEGDDETMEIDLTAVSPDITRIAFCVVIFEATKKQQTFGMVNNAYVRLINVANGETEICRFSLKDDYSTDTSVIFAELVRNGADWEFKAIGEGKRAELGELANYYA